MREEQGKAFTVFSFCKRTGLKYLSFLLHINYEKDRKYMLTDEKKAVILITESELHNT